MRRICSALAGSLILSGCCNSSLDAFCRDVDASYCDDFVVGSAPVADTAWFVYDCGELVMVEDRSTGKDPSRYRFFDRATGDLVGAVQWTRSCDTHVYGDVPDGWCDEDGGGCRCPDDELIAQSPPDPTL